MKAPPLKTPITRHHASLVEAEKLISPEPTQWLQSLYALSVTQTEWTEPSRETFHIARAEIRRPKVQWNRHFLSPHLVLCLLTIHLLSNATLASSKETGKYILASEGGIVKLHSKSIDTGKGEVLGTKILLIPLVMTLPDSVCPLQLSVLWPSTCH